MFGIPTPIEAFALVSALVSIGCLVMAGIHAVRFEKHQHKGDKQ